MIVPGARLAGRRPRGGDPTGYRREHGERRGTAPVDARQLAVEGTRAAAGAPLDQGGAGRLGPGARAPIPTPLAVGSSCRLPRRPRRRRRRGHRPGGVSRRDPVARSIRPPATLRTVAEPHRGQPRHRLGARSVATAGDGHGARNRRAPERSNRPPRGRLGRLLRRGGGGVCGHSRPSTGRSSSFAISSSTRRARSSKMLGLPRGTVNSRLRRGAGPARGGDGDASDEDDPSFGSASARPRSPTRTRLASVGGRWWRRLRGAAVRAPQPARIRVRVALPRASAALVAGARTRPRPARRSLDFVRDVVKPERQGGRRRSPPCPLWRPAGRVPARALGRAEDGSQRLLGDYRQASMVARTAYYVARDKRASTERRGAGSAPCDGPLNRAPAAATLDARRIPGYRIAYRTGSSMRVVGGDGVGRSPRSTATWLRPPPAWAAPLPQAKLEAARASTCSPSRSPTARWRRSTPTRARCSGALLRPRAGGARDWSADGSRLAALSATELRVFTAQGDLTQTVHLPSGLRAADGAFAPTGKSFAVTATQTHGTWPAERGADPQR